ncbi:hypothetical protein ACQ4PT_041203 [Festuca glaucescens]
MLPGAMPYRGLWKWLGKRKRKRVDAQEEEEYQEDEGIAGELLPDGVDAQEEEEEDEGIAGELLPDVPQPIIWGSRSHLGGEDWVCELCGFKNIRTRHLFVDLPAFHCGRCNAQTRQNFRFSFGNLAANGICPIGEILDQGNTNDCLVFALVKANEITARILEILLDSGVVVPTLDPYSLKAIFKASRLAVGIDARKIDYIDEAAMIKMMELMQTVGVQDKKREHTCKIGGVEQVHGFFEDIATELAKGYPLVVDMIPGSVFGDLMYGEVYRCPFNNRNIPKRRRKRITTHIVILVGAARWGDIDYFYFLNSYGEQFCVRIHRDGEQQIGGIGKILANDICSPPYKLLRCVP